MTDAQQRQIDAKMLKFNQLRARGYDVLEAAELAGWNDALADLPVWRI